MLKNTPSLQTLLQATRPVVYLQDPILLGIRGGPIEVRQSRPEPTSLAKMEWQAVSAGANHLTLTPKTIKALETALATIDDLVREAPHDWFAAANKGEPPNAWPLVRTIPGTPS